MSASLEFLLGLLEHAHPAHAAWEDFQGQHGKALRRCQQMGFVSRYPGMHPAPSCPHCEYGAPYSLGERVLCNRCHSIVDRQHLLIWPLDLEAFLGWFAKKLKLRGDVRSVAGQLWQLGTGTEGDASFECFFYRSGALTEAEKQRLKAYGQTVLICGRTCPLQSDYPGPSRSLLGILDFGEALKVRTNVRLLETDRAIRFDRQTGTLWGGTVRLGEVPLGSRQFFFLECLVCTNLDRFVPYADLKRYVQQRSGRTAATEEASFCQKLKSRIKERSVPQIDELVVTSNKGDGYRMKGSW